MWGLSSGSQAYQRKTLPVESNKSPEISQLYPKSPEKPTCHLFLLGGGISSVAQKSRSSWSFFQKSNFYTSKNPTILTGWQIAKVLGKSDPKHILPNVGAKWWWIRWDRICNKITQKANKRQEMPTWSALFLLTKIEKSESNWVIFRRFGVKGKSIRNHHLTTSKRSSRTGIRWRSISSLKCCLKKEPQKK